MCDRTSESESETVWGGEPMREMTARVRGWEDEWESETRAGRNECTTQVRERQRCERNQKEPVRGEISERENE